MESLRKKNRPAVLKGEKEAQHKEKNERTVFVGNLPISSMTKQGTKELTKVFGEHGKIDSIRFRSFAMANHMDRKGAYITKKFHNNRDEVNGYVVYKTKEEAEKAAAALDGSVYMEKHLRVDLANASPVRRESFIQPCYKLTSLFLDSCRTETTNDLSSWVSFHSMSRTKNYGPSSTPQAVMSNVFVRCVMLKPTWAKDSALCSSQIVIR
jgi:RNA recognition motif-containing protein